MSEIALRLMPERHPPAYLSASRLSCYDRCPQLFYERYILKLPQVPSVEMRFGTAVHKGLEAHYRGHDAELAYLADWRAASVELQAAGQAFGTGLKQRGLELLDAARALDLEGEPERKFMLTAPGLSMPILGYIDLWSEHNHTVVDFKTAGYGWNQARADSEQFQPAIYSQAYADECGQIPRFTFIVLPRIAGPVQQFDGSRTADQIIATFERARVIHEAIEAGQFDCIGQACREHREAAA